MAIKKLFFAIILLVLPFFTQAAVLKIQVALPIHPITAEYIIKTIERADREKADLVIIELNTPGGLSSSMQEIIEAIVNSKIPVATYVSPRGARAASAGFFIGVASDIFAMAPGTNTGAAHPVGISILGKELDKTMEDKITHDAASSIKTLAEKRGRNIQMAEDAVRKSLSYTETEALKGGLINCIVNSSTELISYLNGRTIKRFDGQEITFNWKDAVLVEIPMSARQKFLSTISNPNMAYILLMIGLLGLYFEFSHPGAILPGVLGGISLLLAIFSFQILPINYVGLMLILLAIILFILEIKVTSYGMLAVGGIISMVIGSIMLINAPIRELRPGLHFIIPVALGISIIIIFLIYLVFRAHNRPSSTGEEGMRGERGKALTDLNLNGKVMVHGEIWEAAATEPINKGEQIEVVEMEEGLKLKVRKA